MKRYLPILISLVVIVVIAVMFSGCSSKDKDSFTIDDLIGPGSPNFEDFDYIISVEHWVFEDRGSYSVYIETNNPDGFQEEISLLIDGEEVALVYHEWGQYYSAVDNLEEGMTYDFILITESKNYSATLKLPHIPYDVVFPAVLDIESAQTLTWSLQDDNKYQIVSFANLYWNGEEMVASSYVKVIDPSDREHTVPANSIESQGFESNLAMSLAQVDFVAKGSFLAAVRAVYQKDDFEDYDRELLKKESRESLPEIIKNLK